MTHLAALTRLRTALGLLALLVLASACDSAQALSGADAVELTADASAEALAQEAGLSADGQEALARSFAQHSDTTEAGRLWRVAADLQQNLGDDQKARLVERGQRFSPPKRGHKGGQRPGMSHGRLGGALADSLGLSETQKDAVKAIYAEYRPHVEALMQQRRDGTLDADGFAAAMETLRGEIEAKVADVLTPEQLARLEAMKADRQARRDERQGDREERQAEREERRAEVKAVMTEVLGLSAEEVEALETLREAHHAAMRELLATFRGQDADRQAARAALEALHADHQAELATVLDETQLEVVYIHHALTQHARKHRGGVQGGERQRPQRPQRGRRG